MSHNPKIRAAALTDIGKIRRRNEDRAIFDGERLVFGVADGVGGIPGGDEAAQAALDAVLGAFAALPPSAEPDLRAIVLGAGRLVAEKGDAISPAKGIGSTLTFGCVREGRLMIAHVGDSRCYGVQRGRLVRLTEDHTVECEASRRRRLGEAACYYAPEEARALTRWLGGPGLPEPDLLAVSLAAGDSFLFCTDGMTGLVSDAEIGAVLTLPEEPVSLLKILLDMAARRGGVDNATGVLLRVDET